MQTLNLGAPKEYEAIVNFFGDCLNELPSVVRVQLCLDLLASSIMAEARDVADAKALIGKLNAALLNGIEKDFQLVRDLSITENEAAGRA